MKMSEGTVTASAPAPAPVTATAPSPATTTPAPASAPSPATPVVPPAAPSAAAPPPVSPAPAAVVTVPSPAPAVPAAPPAATNTTGTPAPAPTAAAPSSTPTTAILRRNRPGTKAKDFCRWPDELFEEMDSTLAVQQYIQQTIRRDPSNFDYILTMPDAQDEGVWKYEHLRQFCMELNGLAVQLQEECRPDKCNQMTATDQWIFLCAAHKTPKECPAIDYTRHTLDGAACLLNSNKYFPSRVSIKDSSVMKLGSVCRRVYRIFSHAFFHHRHIFYAFETTTYLCHRFTRFVEKYKLMSNMNLIVPIVFDESGQPESPPKNPALTPEQPVEAQ